MEHIMPTTSGFPPSEVSAHLRIEGLVAFAAAIAAYQYLGGNWWLFALLILAPDLSMFGWLRGEAFGARAYNLAHTYTAPAVLAGIGYSAGATYLLPFAVIWAAHIAADRALGYGLKYPGLPHHTHLGAIGKLRKEAKVAHAG
jgi:hypothetical protein